jgi:hypothetical protein
LAHQGDGPNLDFDPSSILEPADRPEEVMSSPEASPAKQGRVRAEPERGLIIIVDAAGRERPYLVTKAEALMLLVLCEGWPGWIPGAEMKRLDSRIYNPTEILARPKGKRLSGFKIETDAGKRMRLVID